MNRSDYLAKARHNEEFLESIDKNRFCDWWVTASFYVALHYVNAFVSVSIKSGFCSHEGPLHAGRGPRRLCVPVDEA